MSDDLFTRVVQITNSNFLIYFVLNSQQIYNSEHFQGSNTWAWTSAAVNSSPSASFHRPSPTTTTPSLPTTRCVDRRSRASSSRCQCQFPRACKQRPSTHDRHCRSTHRSFSYNSSSNHSKASSMDDNKWVPCPPRPFTRLLYAPPVCHHRSLSLRWIIKRR